MNAEEQRLKELGIEEDKQMETYKALLADERSAVASYEDAIDMLSGEVDDKIIEALEEIKKDELDHIKKLDAIINGKDFEEIK